MKLALVVGSSQGMWDDVRAAREMAKFDAVCCVKRTGIEWPEPFDVWAGLHPEFMNDFVARRRAKGFRDGYEIVCPPDKELGEHGSGIPGIDRRVSYLWPGMNASAGSGIYGAKVMLDAGYNVVLAGIPMTTEPHFLNHDKWGKGTWNEVSSFISGMQQAIPHMKGRARSMSGETAKLLGRPDPEWLAGR